VTSIGSSGLFPVHVAGQRAFDLHDSEAISALIASDGVFTAAATELMDAPCRAVRILMFDKTPDANWSVPWHQDRTVAVQGRADVEGYGPWSRKGGVLHVEPPAELLAGMVALRLHVDDCGEDNGALEVIPGSWKLGRVAAGEIAGIVSRGEVQMLTARAGDVVAMRGLTLHASKRAERPVHRRVLHIDFTTRDLPPPLDWAMTEPRA
jgi:ectoine hydroxylase-related dioxygenase (phytanoyl-CoA dioxygenase family)